MKRLPGQAARHLGRTGHRLLTAAFASSVIAMASAAVLAWRLAQGPIPIGFLAHRIEAALNEGAGPVTVHVGRAEIAWEGFRSGVDRPLDIRVEDIAATTPAGQTVIGIPRADMALSVGGLLLGRLMPRRIAMMDAAIRLQRAADGAISLDLGTRAGPAAKPPDATPPADNQAGTADNQVAPLLRELQRPAQTDIGTPRGSRYAQLRRVLLRRARVTIDDRALGLTWHASLGEADLARLSQGGVEGTAAADLALGDQSVHVEAKAALDAGASHTRITGWMGPVRPAALAGAAPALAPLAALDAPVSASFEAVLGPSLDLDSAHADIVVGKGTATLNGTPIALDGARLDAAGGPDSVTVNALRLEVVGHPGAPPSVITASGTVSDPLRHPRAQLTLAVDQVAFADLPNLWPKGAGGPGARDWVTQNITGGIARNGQFHATLDIRPDLSDIGLPEAGGSIEGQDMTLYWLRPLPPIEHAQATLRIVDPDTLDVGILGGRLHPSGAHGEADQSALQLTGGTMRITGIMHPHQLGKIDADIAGPIPSAIALLREKRLRLLDKHPLDLRDPAGSAAVKLGVTVPLEDSVTVEQIGIRAEAHLDGVHLTAVVAGRDLDRGTFDLIATNDGMTARGRGTIGGFDAQLGAEMDFRAGPPSQVLESVTASGRADARQLAQAGLNIGAAYSGTTGLVLKLAEHRDGTGTLDVACDLRDADLNVHPLAWRKPPGRPASGEIKLRLEHDKLLGADLISLDAESLSLRAQAAYSGRGTEVHLDRLVLGNTDASGDVHIPPGGNGPITASLTGRQLDLSPRFSEHTRPARARPAETEKPSTPPGTPPGTSWSMDARFERALMNRGQVVSDLSLHADYDGRLYRHVLLNGKTGDSAFRLEVAPASGGRTVSAQAASAGELLRALDVVSTMSGGTLSLSGRFDDGKPDQPLSGEAVVTDFRMRNTPWLGKLLQVMTLYGLYDVLQGPGLGFARLEAPFTLENDTLSLQSARAVSPSLGITAQGTIDLAANTGDLRGTIVPAYVFNSLLGRIPVLGWMFSPEKGGGVIAARYSVRGPLESPEVTVNPLSTFTPGFLRNLFNIF